MKAVYDFAENITKLVLLLCVLVCLAAACIAGVWTSFQIVVGALSMLDWDVFNAIMCRK